MLSRASVLATAAAALAAVLSLPAPAGQAAAPVDPYLRAVDVVPPGESGLDTAAQFAGATTGVAGNGPHVDDQLGLYAGWQYKSMQLSGPKQGTPAPGDPAVTLWRDSYGVPTVTAASEGDAFYGLGYAMAQDRLFQMEVFRHVGAGTLASLIGPAGLPMDVSVRRVTEGAAGRLAEYQRLPAATRERVQRFVDGVNADIQQVQTDPTTQPAEFTLLGDQPIAPWTVDDVLSFGEYAGRFFGQFTGANLTAAAVYLDLVKRFGQHTAEQAYNDLFQLDDPRAPTSLAAADGVFPRHSGAPAPHRFGGSRYANHDPALLPPLAQLLPVARAVMAASTAMRTARRLLGLPGWGSNAFVSTAPGTGPMLYGGPQTGWAVPGFFWEAEVHDPVRAQRGVMVPDIPLFVIGRNRTSAWTVTSALDANADVFAEQLDQSNTSYRHNGKRLTVTATTESIPCKNPPTAATALLSASVPALCPVPDRQITVYRTVHGPGLADPDSGHHLYTLASVVDGHLLESLDAWDGAGRADSASTFGRSLQRMSLGFNFLYVGGRPARIGYWHTGRYPLRAANADPALPQPGDGSFDWRGFESWAAHPQAIDPKAGFVVNWNNKPSVGWWSPPVVGEVAQPDRWGDTWEVAPLVADVAANRGASFSRAGLIPRDVAYLDNRARVLLPTLRSALRATTDPTIRTVAKALASWDGQRNHLTKGSYGPAITFFDRFVEHLLADVVRRQLPAEYPTLAGLACARPPCHYASVDNEDAPNHKWEGVPEQTLLAALGRHTAFDWLGRAGGPLPAFRAAAAEAATELSTEQGADPAKWAKPAEATTFSAQGAISVPPIVPFMNRGSYGHLVQVIPAAATHRTEVNRPAGRQLPTTGLPTLLPALGLALLALAAVGRLLTRPGRRRTLDP